MKQAKKCFCIKACMIANKRYKYIKYFRCCTRILIVCVTFIYYYLFFISSDCWSWSSQRHRGGDLRLWERRRSIALTLLPRRLHPRLVAGVPSLGQETSHSLHGGADQHHGEGLQEERLSGDKGQGRAVQEAQSLWQTGNDPRSGISLRIEPPDIVLFSFQTTLLMRYSSFFPDQKLVPEQADEAEEDGAGCLGSCLPGQRCLSVHALPWAAGLQAGALPKVSLHCTSGCSRSAASCFLHPSTQPAVQLRSAQCLQPAPGLLLPVQRPAYGSHAPHRLNSSDWFLPSLPSVLLTLFSGHCREAWQLLYSNILLDIMWLHQRLLPPRMRWFI